VKTFSIDFPEADYSEAEHAGRVADLYGTEHEVRLLEPDMVPLIAEAVHHAGEPFADSSAIPTLLLSGMTKERVTVALSGDGGDEAFAGYPRYLSATTADRLDAAGGVARLLDRAGATRGRRIRASRLGRVITNLSMTSAERYAAKMSHFTPRDLRQVCSPGFLELAGDTQAAWRNTLKPPPIDGVDGYLALDIRTYLPGDLLLKVDRMSMAHALEVRSPLLDYRVQELAASLPASMKLRGRTTKWALKELARRRGLPPDLVRRRKQGFGVPVGAWLRDRLRPWVEGLLLDPRSLRRGYFDEAQVRRLLDRHLRGEADNTSRVWNLAMLELWHRSWIDAD
jgi:asparagine synthase (glutamine-hydrolysing)